MTFWIAIASAVGTAVSLVLHALGGRYKKAEKAAEFIDGIEKKLS